MTYVKNKDMLREQELTAVDRSYAVAPQKITDDAVISKNKQ